MGHWVPNFVYGSVTLLVAMLMFSLVETKGKSLPETIQDGIVLARNNENNASNNYGALDK